MGNRDGGGAAARGDQHALGQRERTRTHVRRAAAAGAARAAHQPTQPGATPVEAPRAAVRESHARSAGAAHHDLQALAGRERQRRAHVRALPARRELRKPARLVECATALGAVDVKRRRADPGGHHPRLGRARIRASDRRRRSPDHRRRTRRHRRPSRSSRSQQADRKRNAGHKQRHPTRATKHQPPPFPHTRAPTEAER
jgi:hypothetical protein